MAHEFLSTWNQCAPRGYVRQWYCFPTQPDLDVERLRDHLAACLEQLATRFPYIKKRVSLLASPAGCVAFEPVELDAVPLEMLDERHSFGYTYAQLRAQGFPAKAFVGPSFGDLPCALVPGQPGVPVYEVHVRIIKGGLLLCHYCHHAVTDGVGVEQLLRCFAELSHLSSRDLSVKAPADTQVDIPPAAIFDSRPELASRSFGELVRACPEYAQLPSLTGPTQPLMDAEGRPLHEIRKTGRIFAFREGTLDGLKQAIFEHSRHRTRAPSKFTCLAAITWAHVTRARLRLARHNSHLSSSSSSAAASFPGRIRIMLCINWRQRAFQGLMSHASGNMVALSVSSIDTETIMAACGDDSAETTLRALGVIAATIEATVSQVDEDFIAARTAMLRACPDPRLLGIDLDPRDPSSFIFNTWRHYSTESQRWALPGVVDDDGDDAVRGTPGRRVSPDAIRRSQAEWNMGAGLMLPAGADPSLFEVLVTLEEGEMLELCKDPGWRRWVDRVVE